MMSTTIDEAPPEVPVDDDDDDHCKDCHREMITEEELHKRGHHYGWPCYLTSPCPYHTNCGRCHKCCLPHAKPR